MRKYLRDNSSMPQRTAELTKGKKMQATETKQGAVKIGSGTKLHPARIDPVYGVIIQCSCPGTRQGSASKYARFFEGASRTCRV